MASAMVGTAHRAGSRRTHRCIRGGAVGANLRTHFRGRLASMSMQAEEEDRDRLVARLRVQGRTAGQLGSPLYAELLTGAAADVAAGGPCWAVLARFAHEPDSAAVPLRFLAAVHRLVLRRLAPGLALHYRSVGGQAGVQGAWPLFLATVEQHHEVLLDLTALPCQTNEVGRSAALAPGLLWAQGRTGLPVHHMEIGTSAGLNLRWDAFRYGTADGAVTWGAPDSPVDLTGHWLRPPRGLPDAADVVARLGCDPAPGDPADAGTREDLTASIWADQHARHERLRGALVLAGRIPVVVDAGHAAPWLTRRLAERPEGAVTVVGHSVVWRYLGAREQQAVRDLLAAHGAEATARTPLVWLRLEPTPPAMVYDGAPYPITATTWPGGITTILGTAQAHGQEVRWAGSAEAAGAGATNSRST